MADGPGLDGALWNDPEGDLKAFDRTLAAPEIVHCHVCGHSGNPPDFYRVQEGGRWQCAEAFLCTWTQNGDDRAMGEFILRQIKAGPPR